MILQLGSGGATHGEDITNFASWITMIVLGPLSGVAYGAALIVIAPTVSWVWLAGVYAAANEVFNLLPIGPAGMDGRRLYRHLRGPGRGPQPAAV